MTSPNTGETIGSVPDGQEADIDSAVAAARRAFDDPTGWSAVEPAERAATLRRFADAVEARKDEFARRVSAQNGMPIAVSAQLEAVYPAVLLRYYADLVENQAEDVRDGLFGGTVRVERAPVGVVAAIVPWNFPQTLASFKFAPALAAGCTVVMKPSPETVLDGQLLAEAAIEAALPAGVLNIVPGGREVGAHLVAHRGVDKVGFTGSTAAGRQIAETCGRLLRPATLELGGKSATIVLDDATLDLASIGADSTGGWPTAPRPTSPSSPAWPARSTPGGRSSWPTSTPEASRTGPPRPSTCSSRRSNESDTGSATSTTTGCAYSCTAESNGTLSVPRQSEDGYHAQRRRAR